jgi:hypothetical protein
VWACVNETHSRVTDLFRTALAVHMYGVMPLDAVCFLRDHLYAAPLA